MLRQFVCCDLLLVPLSLVPLRAAPAVGSATLFSSSLAFVTACVRKTSLPRNRPSRASCPSRVLRIPEGHCELVLLSVWDECPLLRFLDILLKPCDGYSQLLFRPNALPCYRVQGSANSEEPSPATVWPVQCLWFDPFGNQVILSLVPQRSGFEVAT